MTHDERKLQSYYASRAPEYDEVYRKPERQADLRSIERWLPPHFSGVAMLEVACGTGYWTAIPCARRSPCRRHRCVA